MPIDATIDAKSDRNPMVVMRAKKIIDEMPGGSTVELLATDPMSETDVKVFCETQGHELVRSANINGVFQFVIKLKV